MRWERKSTGGGCRGSCADEVSTSFGLIGLFMFWPGDDACWMYDNVGDRGWLLAGMLLACKWVVGSGVRTVGSWPYGLVREMVFWCVKYELIRS
jgi:hypothetical protein